LDEIWGSHPNTSVILNTETLVANPPSKPTASVPAFVPPASVSAPVSEPVSESSSEPASQMPSKPTSEPASEPASRRGSPAIYSTPVRSQSKRSEKQDLNIALKRVFEERQAIQQELGLKRIKADKEVKMEIARIQADAQAKQMEEIAHIQADAQVKQMEIFTRMAKELLGASRGGSGDELGGRT